MKKNTKKTIIATLIGGITTATIATALLCVKPVKASDDASLYMQDTYTKTVDAKSLCNSGKKLTGKKFSYKLNALPNEVLNSFEEQFESSLVSFNENGSWLTYQDNANEIPSMEAYVAGLGYVKGQRESTCGANSEFSSWIYTINDEYYSRIVMSSQKLDGYVMSPSNSNYYYKSSTWYSNKETIKVPNFKLVDDEMVNEYKNFGIDSSNINVNVPHIEENFLVFEGNFIGLDNDATYLWGISNSNYDRNTFSSKNMTNCLVTDFANFWHVKSSKTDMYMLNGHLAEVQLKKLMIQIFSNEILPCNNFEEDCVMSAKEVCGTLDSFYCPVSIQNQFFDFEIEYATEGYYNSLENDADDPENYGYYGISKVEYDNCATKPFVRVSEMNEWTKSIIEWKPNVFETEVIQLAD